ncbi:hypothetical protein ENBRE01_3023 [Enteropsectra breve]|nr:hypothetical protein ENBRE01_3023 [Enteropsectra breve]
MSLVYNHEISYSFYFIDEVGFNMPMRMRGGRLLRGERATHTVTSNKDMKFVNMHSNE